MSIFFISGIDTNIGKTVATGVLAASLHRAGRRVVTAKLIQTGNDGFSEDLERHRRMMNLPPFPEDLEHLTAPQIFAFPASPHLAAEREHRTVDFNAIDRALRILAERYETVLLEGAGGLMVPLTADRLTIDWAAERRFPLLLVTSGRLGSLNHTFLSIEAAVRRKMTVAGVLFNWSPDADPEIEADAKQMIRRCLVKYGCAPALIEIPHVEGDDAPDVDLSPIFGGAR